MKKIKKNIGIGTYLSKYKFGVSLYIITTIFASVCDIVITLLFASAIQNITEGLFLMSLYCLLGVLGVTIFRRVCLYTSYKAYTIYSLKIMADLNLDLAKQSFKLNSKTYSDNETSVFVQRIVNDPEYLIGNLAGIIDRITSIVSACVMVVYIMTLNIWIALVLIGVLLVSIPLEFVRIKRRRKNKKDVRRKSEKISSLTTEIVRSEKDIKSLGLEDKLSETSKSYYDEYKNASRKMEISDLNIWTPSNVLIEIISVAVLILGIYLMNKGLFTLAAFMIVYANNGNLYDLVWSFGHIANSFVDVKVCTERMFSLFDENEFVTEKFGEIALPDQEGGGEIVFEKVCYSFKEFEFKEIKATDKKGKKQKKKEKVLVSENQIFKNLSFKISANTTVAFVGKSGSGKSTILNLMSKMFEVDSGEVLINGYNINTLDKNSLRSTISLVNQFPYIFDMTIKENLLLAKKDASDEEINQAIKDASFDDFIALLQQGVDTKVGESGIKLSGGQKQRLAIARALLRKSNIIIFDESTSSLDNFAQNNIKKTIDDLKGKTTAVIVAHRLTTIKDVDKIFFLDEGEIVDSGTFEELFKKNEKFKTMFMAENL